MISVLVRGVQSEIQDAEFEEGLISGRFAPGDLYWREGMTAWQPVPIQEKELPENDPEILIHNMLKWKRPTEVALLAGAVFAIIGMPFIALSASGAFDEIDGLLSTIALILSLPVVAGYFLAGVAVYILPAVWLYHLCMAAKYCEKPLIPPGITAISWCTPLANLILPLFGLLSVLKTARISTYRDFWLIVGATLGVMVFQILAIALGMAGLKGFFWNLIGVLWLLFDAVKYLAWRNLAQLLPGLISEKIRKKERARAISL
jgi:hypothetical protein